MSSSPLKESSKIRPENCGDLTELAASRPAGNMSTPPIIVTQSEWSGSAAPCRSACEHDASVARAPSTSRWYLPDANSTPTTCSTPSLMAAVLSSRAAPSTSKESLPSCTESNFALPCFDSQTAEVTPVKPIWKGLGTGRPSLPLAWPAGRRARIVPKAAFVRIRAVSTKALGAFSRADEPPRSMACM